MSFPSVWSKLSGNVGHLLNATVLTSLSFHLLFARRDAASERAQFTARISILESLNERLRKGEHIPDAEVEKLTVLSRKMQRGSEVEGQPDERGGRKGITWKEALLGREAPSGTTQL
ncbi:hypothetical protein JB92DRAFT_3012530 [Gautieria morchelliformis]|nr:hypothetical protein JB92DRAFT_3012530 [Gautieria morchelliformis]